MVLQSFEQISCFSETLFFHLSARFYGHLILTMPYIQCGIFNLSRVKDTQRLYQNGWLVGWLFLV